MHYGNDPRFLRRIVKEVLSNKLYLKRYKSCLLGASMVPEYWLWGNEFSMDMWRTNAVIFNNISFKPAHNKICNKACANSENSDQPAHPLIAYAFYSLRAIQLVQPCFNYKCIGNYLSKENLLVHWNGWNTLPNMKKIWFIRAVM